MIWMYGVGPPNRAGSGPNRRPKLTFGRPLRRRDDALLLERPVHLTAQGLADGEVRDQRRQGHRHAHGDRHRDRHAATQRKRGHQSRST